MTESMVSVVWPCGVLAVLLGCARVEGNGPPPGREPTGSGGSVSGGMRAGSGGASGTGGSPDLGGSMRGTLEADAGSTEARVCGLFHAPLERQPPDVLVLLDRSA